MTNYSGNPKVSFAAIKLEDTLMRLKDYPDEDFTDITCHKESVIRKYQMVFFAGANIQTVKRRVPGFPSLPQQPPLG